MVGLAGTARAGTIDLDVIGQIESGGRSVVGDNGASLGVYQIQEPVVREYNQFNKTEYSHADMMDERVGRIVADWYINKRIPQMIRHYGKPDTVRNRIIAYNAGIKYVKDGLNPPKITERYIRRYENATV
jgi:hypothetical protein